ncbi:DUF5925 domain-containing protein [Streptomyces sp. NPDC054847]
MRAAGLPEHGGISANPHAALPIQLNFNDSDSPAEVINKLFLGPFATGGRRPSWLMSSPPLGDQEVRQFGQAPGANCRWCSVGGLRDLFDLAALGQRGRLRTAVLVLRIQRLEAVGVAVVDHIPGPSALVNDTSAILAIAMPCADRSMIWARRQVTTDPVPLRTIRQQPQALVVIVFARPHPLRHGSAA